MPGAVPSLYASVHLIFMAVKYGSMINSIFLEEEAEVVGS